MGSGGHNKKPTILHLAHGTYRDDRANPAEPKSKALSEIPRPPSHLNKYGKKKWREIAPVLAETKIISESDLTMLETFCEAYGQYRESQWSVYHTIDRTSGKAVKRTLAEYMAGKNSQTMPEYSAMRQALQLVRSIAAEFGLSPVSRSKVAMIDEPDKQDPMEKLLEGAG